MEMALIIAVTKIHPVIAPFQNNSMYIYITLNGISDGFSSDLHCSCGFEIENRLDPQNEIAILTCQCPVIFW